MLANSLVYEFSSRVSHMQGAAMHNIILLDNLQVGCKIAWRTGNGIMPGAMLGLLMRSMLMGSVLASG